MDVEGPLSKTFAVFFTLCFGILFFIALFALVVVTKGLFLIVALVFLLILLGCFFVENKEEIFNKFKRGKK
ncbi:hypothetical protein Bestia_00022 [Acinetobacter phage Bestia]|nr:hypothetical protein Bestia_00022 [Acinetobacter phage Bestia]